MELQKDEEECEAKVKKFNRLLRIYEPSSLSPNVLREIWEECYDKLYMALSEMVDSIERLSITHEQELGSYVVDVWKQKITDGQGEFVNFINMVGSKLEPPQNNVSPNAVAEVMEFASMEVKVYTEGDHADATKDEEVSETPVSSGSASTALPSASGGGGGGGVLGPFGNLPTNLTNPTPALAPASSTTPALTSALYSKDDEDEEEASGHEITHFEAAKVKTSDEVTNNGVTMDELAVATTNHVPTAVESMGGVREDQDGCRGRDWMLLMSILRKFRTGSRPQMSFMNLWGGASRMTLCLAPTPYCCYS